MASDRCPRTFDEAMQTHAARDIRERQAKGQRANATIGPATTAEAVAMEKQMNTSRIGLMVLVLLLLAFVVATPTAFAAVVSVTAGAEAHQPPVGRPSR